ncbi:MAG: PEP-CTERM sorting domain-containing protein [Deltaproteobacteria bacterium]|nr:PEP-CTERM sorting domain-containing protein [Deltaproteobacteria bacterium]
MKKIALLSVFLVLIFSGSAFALTATYFGEDLGLGESTRLTSFPNATAAEADFLSNLVGVGTEDFESLSGNAPLSVDFGVAGTATLSGSGYVSTVPSGTNTVGRYPISGDNYFETSSANFSIAFSDPIAAFGFYGIDFGDFNGQILATFANGTSTAYEIPHTVGAPGGSVIYWGLIDTESLFTSVTFSNIGSSADAFGFDNFTIGSVEQVVPTPEPGTIFMMGLGLLGLAGMGRKKLFRK